jgi:FAD/FMN-containing dehydrogenase
MLMDFALKHIEKVIDPLGDPHPWYILAEASTGTEGDMLRNAIEQALGTAMEDGLVLDATLAASETQRNAFWFIREAIVQSQKFEGGSIKHDISVPVSRVADFIARASEAVKAAMPGIRPVPFGHVGDGNIHFNLTQPTGADQKEYMAEWERMNHIVHEVALDLGGSISAEHGIGRFKRDEMRQVKSPVELDMMLRVKAALDPEGLMNPQALLPGPSGDQPK